MTRDIYWNLNLSKIWFLKSSTFHKYYWQIVDRTITNILLKWKSLQFKTFFFLSFLKARHLFQTPQSLLQKRSNYTFAVLTPVFASSHTLNWCLYYSIVSSSVLMKFSLTTSAFLSNGHANGSAITE